MMNETNDCYSNDDDVDFCNGAAPFHIIIRMKQKSYNYDRDCVYDWSYAFTSPPPGMCVFSPEDIEAWEREEEDVE